MSIEANATSFPSASSLDSGSLMGLIGGGWAQFPAALFERRFAVASKTADYTLLNTENGKLFTNLGASGTITLTLPAAVVGLHYIFMVRAAQQLRIDPNGTELLESTATPAVAGTAGQYIWADAIGESIHLVCLETGKWAVVSFKGTWTVA